MSETAENHQKYYCTARAAEQGGIWWELSCPLPNIVKGGGGGLNALPIDASEGISMHVLLFYELAHPQYKTSSAATTVGKRLRASFSRQFQSLQTVNFSNLVIYIMDNNRCASKENAKRFETYIQYEMRLRSQTTTNKSI